MDKEQISHYPDPSEMEIQSHRLDSIQIDIIGPQTRFSGDIEFGQTVRVEGHIDGKIHIRKTKGAALIVGQTALINADIRCRKIVIEGVVRGDVIATDVVEIRKDGALLGNVQTPRLIICDGGFLEGRSLMAEPSTEALPAV
jgi:cytoskeletal protein CcmA (bactofilin family)